MFSIALHEPPYPAAVLMSSAGYRLFLFTQIGFSGIDQREAGDLVGRRAEVRRIERAAEQCDGCYPFEAGNQESERVGVVFLG